MNYIVLNGKYLKNSEAILSFSNRSFRYGDALFETMHANGRRVQFLEKHFERLIIGMEKLKMNNPETFTLKYFDETIASLLSRNKHYKGARIRLTVFRNDGGFYSPTTNDVSFLIESEAIENDVYVLNKTGYLIGIFDEIPKQKTYFSTIKSANSLLYVLAGIFKNENKLDECILVDEQGNFVETISSNIFIVKNKTISTPSITNGCINGIMRNEIISIAKNQNFTIVESSNLNEKDLFEADEIFITNAVNGIRWVVGFKERRYFNKVAKNLIDELNKNCF